ncbi:head morphogenesis [Xanthomonas phage XcP1]|uniref:Minor head protein n=1 Tax=Xanthomonas phage XcP1 TaxID=2785027 RepID=A0A3S7L8F3_9CAUD|nr:head morphogenesis [Xanthomonas phage XcP1]AWN08509.1 minor head protein [Xanthomonas phage XcP1]
MAFKASKKRQRKAPAPVAEGTQLIPSAPIRIKYENSLNTICKEMLEDYKSELKVILKTRGMERFFAEDATPSSKMQTALESLNRKWVTNFTKYARQKAESFVSDVDKHSKSTAWYSMSAAGIEQPKVQYSASIQNTLQGAVEFNETLIKNIQREVHEKIYSAVMLSVTSPNPEEQGVSGIFNAVKSAGEFSKKRAELIARDQNSKVYSSLNTERMRQNGVDQFKWVHSSAGKVPRQSHLDKDGEIFDIDDPRLWEGPKNDQGPPGWAINCRCRAVPVI